MKLLSNIFKHTIATEFLTFIIIGVFSTIVNYGFFYFFFTRIKISYVIASAIGYICGIIFSYFGNKIATFKTSSSFKAKEFSVFLVVYLISLCISLLVLHFLVAVFGVNVFLANLIVIGISTITNFTMLKLFLFKL